MPALRKYGIVSEESGQSIGGQCVSTMRQETRERQIRSVSLTGARSYDSSAGNKDKGNVVFEVTKSPRAPQYTIHYVIKTEGIKQTRKPGRRTPSARTSDDKFYEDNFFEDKSGDDKSGDEEQQVKVKDGLESDGTETDKDMVGLRVIACHKHDGLYYPGYVINSTDAAFAVVTFKFEKKKEKIQTKMIIPMGGAIARPELRLGDFVLVRVYNQTKNTECFVPGIVEVTPEDTRHHAKFYSVLLYNGQRDTTLRKYIVKIGQNRFQMAVKYIAYLQQQRKQQRQNSVTETSTPRSSQSERSYKLEDDSSVSTNYSRSSRSRSKKKQKITQKLVQKENKEPKKHREKRISESSRSSRSGSHSSRSRSKSSRSSRSSRSRSSSRSTVRSGSHRQRSRTQSSGSSRSRSRGERSSRSGSSTPRARLSNPCLSIPSPIERPSNPVPKPRPMSPHPRSNSYLGATRNDIYAEDSSRVSRSVLANEKDEMIQTLQYQLEKQKRKQFRQEQRLVRQARKINKISQKLRDGHTPSQNTSTHSDTQKAHHTSESESELSAHRRKGSPDGTSYKETADVLGGHRMLPGLRQDQEVLARWADDGWYYRGCIVGKVDETRYILADATGYLEEIAREDIITDNEHKFDTIQPQDYVIGLHPNYVFSFAPAEVLGVFSNHCVKVEFYDGNIGELRRDDVYKIAKSKHDQVVDYIKMKERLMLGKTVVARDDNTGVYRLGVVDSRAALGQQYYVKWMDGNMCKQNAHHIFDVGQRQLKHADWTYILAPSAHNNKEYIPVQAKISHSSPLTLSYYDHETGRNLEVRADECFCLEKDYYTNAMNFIFAKSDDRRQS